MTSIELKFFIRILTITLATMYSFGTSRPKYDFSHIMPVGMSTWELSERMDLWTAPLPDLASVTTDDMEAMFSPLSSLGILWKPPVGFIGWTLTDLEDMI